MLIGPGHLRFFFVNLQGFNYILLCHNGLLFEPRMFYDDDDDFISGPTQFNLHSESLPGHYQRLLLPEPLVLSPSKGFLRCCLVIIAAVGPSLDLER